MLCRISALPYSAHHASTARLNASDANATMDATNTASGSPRRSRLANALAALFTFTIATSSG